MYEAIIILCNYIFILFLKNNQDYLSNSNFEPFFNFANKKDILFIVQRNDRVHDTAF